MTDVRTQRTDYHPDHCYSACVTAVTFVACQPAVPSPLLAHATFTGTLSHLPNAVQRRHMPCYSIPATYTARTRQHTACSRGSPATSLTVYYRLRHCSLHTDSSTFTGRFCAAWRYSPHCGPHRVPALCCRGTVLAACLSTYYTLPSNHLHLPRLTARRVRDVAVPLASYQLCLT